MESIIVRKKEIERTKSKSVKQRPSCMGFKTNLVGLEE